MTKTEQTQLQELQQEASKPLDETERNRLEELKSKPNLSPAEQTEQKDLQDKMNNALTPEERTQLQKLQEKSRETTSTDAAPLSGSGGGSNPNSGGGPNPNSGTDPAPQPEPPVTVTFDTQGGSPIPAVNLKRGEKASESANPSKDAFFFAGWYLGTDYSEEFDISTQTIEDDMTLYAKWVQAFTVQFDSDGGTSIPTEVAGDGANRADIEPEDPVKQGHTFLGWHTDQQFDTLFFDGTTITENTTVYAWFIPNSLRSIVLSKTLPPQSELETYDQVTADILSPLAGDTAKELGIIYVTPDGGSTTKDVSSWENAYDAANLKTAIDNAAASAENPYLVLVAEGSYAISETLNMKNHVAIIGGFSGNDVDRGGTTTLYGGGNTQVFSNTGLDNTAVLYGVTISNGFTVKNGGGMSNTKSSPTLSHVTFSENSANQGGGMSNANSSPTLTNVTFSGNTAKEYGGGMRNSQSSPTLSHVTFSGNTAKVYGGGMYNNTNSSPTLSHVTFSGNTADQFGGGMANANSSPTLSHVTFSGNTADQWGGGMINANSSPTLSHVKFSGNTADTGGGMANLKSFPTLGDGVTFSMNAAPTSPDRHDV